MAINFGILQGIQAPQVIGQLPQQPDSMNSLAGGLMQGIQSGLEMQGQVTKNKIAKMELDNSKQSQMDAQTLREASAKGEQAYINALSQVNRSAALDYLGKKQVIQKTLAETININEETKSRGLDNYARAINAMGQVQSSALAGRSPEEQQKIYQIGLSQLPSKVRSAMPDQFDQNSAVATIILAKQNMADYLDKNKKAVSPSDTKRRLDELNQARTAAGQAPLTPEEQAAALQQGLTTSISSNKGQLSPSQQVNIATTTDRLKETGKNANLASQTLNTLSQMEKLSDEALSGQGAGVELKARQFMEYAGIPVPQGTSATEAFNGLVRQAQLSAQTLLKGSSSDRDMEIVAQTGPQLNNTKEGRRMMISAGKYKAKMDQQYNAFLNAYQNKNNGSLDGADEAWTNFTQSRADFDPKTKLFDSDTLNQKAWAPFLDPSFQAPVSKQVTPQSSSALPSLEDIQAEMKRRGL